MTFHLCRVGLTALLVAAAPVMAAAQAALTVEGTELVLTTPSGRVLRSADLVGATLQVGTGAGQMKVTIRSVMDDPDAIGGRIVLHHFVVADDNGRSVDLCSPDAQGGSLGFPVPNGHGGFDLTCTSGAVGKCIRWGYRPWEEKTDGPPLRALHQACTHMVRADYGGDGRSTTRDGTLIYFCDRFGVRPCSKQAPVPFEAAWGTDGAICVARPRIPENISLKELAARYPRLKPRLGHVCNQASALRDPDVLLFNHSGD